MYKFIKLANCYTELINLSIMSIILINKRTVYFCLVLKSNLKIIGNLKLDWFNKKMFKSKKQLYTYYTLYCVKLLTEILM